MDESKGMDYYHKRALEDAALIGELQANAEN